MFKKILSRRQSNKLTFRSYLQHWWALLFAVVLGAASPAYAGLLWYNGDFDNLSSLTNEINTTVSQASVYDDFIVPIADGGWLIYTIWSNNLMNFNGVNSATWSIRSGVSSGNSGTVVAGGTSVATQLTTGRSGFGYTEYTIEVSGLSINLIPGTYWLSVTPIGFGSGRSFNSGTSGLNSVGTPPGNNGNSFIDSTFFASANFTPSSLFFGFPRENIDFSMGVGGTISAVPEPATLALLGLGLAGLGLTRRRQRT